MRLGLAALALLLAGCSSVVTVDETIEYKCGEQIVVAEYLDDESVIIKMNGTNTVLSSSATDSGKRYDNSNSQMTLIDKDDSVYLSVKGKIYPMCLEIKR